MPFACGSMGHNCGHSLVFLDAKPAPSIAVASVSAGGSARAVRVCAFLVTEKEKCYTALGMSLGLEMDHFLSASSSCPCSLRQAHLVLHLRWPCPGLSPKDTPRDWETDKVKSTRQAA